VSIAELPNRSARSNEAEFERIPPQDLIAEQSVLGGMLLSKDAIADAVEILRERDFYRPAHELIYDAILDLYGRGEPADAVTLLPPNSPNAVTSHALVVHLISTLSSHLFLLQPMQAITQRLCVNMQSCAA
jgi:hypothetical protein